MRTTQPIFVSITDVSKLDVIQNQAFRHIVGAIETTPIAALEVETKIPLLRIQRTYFAQGYFTPMAFWFNNELIAKFLSISHSWRFVPTKKPLFSKLTTNYDEILSRTLFNTRVIFIYFIVGL